MPYFKLPDGRRKGHVNDEATMVKLEEGGCVRLEGRELLVRIVWEALKKWGIPAVCALATFYYFIPDEFVVGLVVFALTQKILD